MAEKLDAGSLFPTIRLTPVDGDPITVPEQLDSRYTILLFYRGDW